MLNWYISVLVSVAQTFGWHFFQVNQNESQSKVGSTHKLIEQQNLRWSDPKTLIEVFCVFLVLAAFAFTIAPGVNESHYLTKAKQFWNPNWCPGDLFLESSDAHYLFFLTSGWLTLIASLEVTAWIGRIGCWLAFACAWVHMNRKLSLRPMLSVISATLFMLLSSRFDMAGEWVVGGFEAKSVAYVFIILAVSWYSDKKIVPAIVGLGMATAFHAVVGGWAILCFTGAILTEALLTRSVSHLNFDRYTKRQWYFGLAIFCSLVALGCLPPLISGTGEGIESVRAASYIQVHERLTHHLLFQSFPSLHVGRFVFLIAIWLLITRTVFISRKFQRLSWFCNGSLIISLFGVILSGLADMPDSLGSVANSLLRFYWFRFSDFALPLGVSLFSVRLFDVLYKAPMRSQRILASASAALLVLACLTSIVQDNMDFRAAADKAILPNYVGEPLRTRQSYENWRKACYWIKNNTRTDSTFLTPAQQQTFKWYAHRAEFACWKDMPQDANSIVKWRQRINLQRNIDHKIGGALRLTDEQIEWLSHDYGITHFLVPQAQADGLKSPISKMLVRIYPIEEKTRSTYVVYRLNRED